MFSTELQDKKLPISAYDSFHCNPSFRNHHGSPHVSIGLDIMVIITYTATYVYTYLYIYVYIYIHM